MVKLLEDQYKLAYTEFLRRLRDARIRQGLTQTQAATQAGHDQYWLSRCETGARRVDVVEALIFARIYNKPYSYFTRYLIDL
jgi:transcriptional regulator with XRE-family HTH domain